MIDWIIQAVVDGYNACQALVLYIDPNMPSPLAAGLGTALFVFITLKSMEFGYKIIKTKEAT